ncbi:hypothetical protein CBFG_02345 [Clostridiales bacterium 1_7_47FAA]|nr:hypothetical protein CBFG_02345 [Clostridiales bacterium 1_7_47FAA]
MTAKIATQAIKNPQAPCCSQCFGDYLDISSFSFCHSDFMIPIS